MGTPADYNPVAGANFEDVIRNSEKYLQGASTYFYYNLKTWQDHQQPLSSINLVRSNYWNSPDEDPSPYLQRNVSYNDGSGNVIEIKLKVDEGQGYIVNAEENCTLTEIEDRWQC